MVIKNTANMSGKILDTAKLCMWHGREIYKELDDDQEHGMVLYFNGGMELIKHKVVSSGHQDETALDPKIIFRHALLCGGCRIVIFHNHNVMAPPKPSDNDIEATKTLISGGKILCIDVLDHIILSKGGWFSFRNNDKRRGLFNDKRQF